MSNGKMSEEQKHPKKRKCLEDEGNKEIQQLKQKNEELTHLLQRLQADFENYKKRIEKEKSDFIKYSCAEVIAKILPILDSFELALKNKENHGEFAKGIEMIYAQLYDMLEKLGLRAIEAKGKKFDPYKHEVLLQEESDKDEDIITEELQKGYMFHEQVIRTSKIKITKQKESSEEQITNKKERENGQ